MKKTPNKTKQNYETEWLKWIEGNNDIQGNDSTIVNPRKTQEKDLPVKWIRRLFLLSVFHVKHLQWQMEMWNSMMKTDL